MIDSVAYVVLPLYLTLKKYDNIQGRTGTADRMELCGTRSLCQEPAKPRWMEKTWRNVLSDWSLKSHMANNFLWFLVYQAENRLRKRISSQNALLRLKYLLALATFLINRRIFVLVWHDPVCNLCYSRFWLRVIRLAKNPSGDWVFAESAI